MHPSSNYSPQTPPPSTPLSHPSPPHTHTTTMTLLGLFYTNFPPGWPAISQDDSNEVLKSIEK